MDPKLIAEKLSPICDAYRSQGNVHKYHAYRTAIDSIKRFGAVITSSAQLKDLKGVGKSMLQKVDEILKTGCLQQEQDVRADPVAQALKLFTEIHGIGPVMARKLVVENGLRTLEDLRDSDLQLAPQIRLGLKYHDEASARIPYDEIEEHLVYVRRVAKSIDRRLTVSCCGSHRRGLATSGDIDLLLTHPATNADSGCEYVFMAHMLKELRHRAYVVDTLSEGPHKFMGYCRLPASGVPEDRDKNAEEMEQPGIVQRAAVPTRAHRLDMRWFTYDSFYPALLYFTGSDMFNVQMRTSALKLGFTLNEYGIYRLRNDGETGAGQMEPAERSRSPNRNLPAAAAVAGGPLIKGDRLAVNSEKEIFELLRMPFVEPKDRCL